MNAHWESMGAHKIVLISRLATSVHVQKGIIFLQTIRLVSVSNIHQLAIC